MDQAGLRVDLDVVALRAGALPVWPGEFLTLQWPNAAVAGLS
jgi:hypothetical protein